MTTTTDYLVGTAEIAERLLVSSAAVANWRARGLLSPIVELRCGPVYDWREVERFALTSGRVSGVHKRAGRDAASFLPTARRDALCELQGRLSDALAMVSVRLVRPVAKLRGDGAGNGRGEWDWFYALSRSERAHLSRHWMTTDGLEPDVWAMDRHYGDTEAAMADWLCAVRTVDAIRRKRYAGLVSDAGYDLGALFGPDALSYLAGVMGDECEREAVKVVHEFEEVAF